MKSLVVGASGATGKQLVNQLLNSGQQVKVIIRPTSKIPELWNNNDKLTIIRASYTDIGLDEMADYLKDCQAVASCLGHSLNLKGIYGKPRRLVLDTVSLLCKAVSINKPDKPVRFVLMNTTGNRNRDLNEPNSAGQKIVIGLVRLLLPPQRDNEKAADYLRTNIGQDDQYIEWVAVRPDTLLNEDKVSDYEVFPSPIRSPIFNPGKTSRINVAHFMSELITGEDLWKKWKGQMPVIYNKELE